MRQDDYWIPRQLDAPHLFFLWEADSAVLCIITMLLCLLYGSFVFGLVVTLLLLRGYRKLKEEGGRGLMVRLLYWYTPSQWISKDAPSCIREYYGG